MHDHRELAPTADVEQIRRLARTLDTSLRIPGTRIRFGVDAIVGLIPGVGDATGFVLSSAVIVLAVARGARGATVVRMIGLAALDTVMGAVPILGTVFDVGFKANTRNLALLERHVVDADAARAESRGALLLTVAGLALAGVACMAVVIGLGVALAQALS